MNVIIPRKFFFLILYIHLIVVSSYETCVHFWSLYFTYSFSLQVTLIFQSRQPKFTARQKTTKIMSIFKCMKESGQWPKKITFLGNLFWQESLLHLEVFHRLK